MVAARTSASACCKLKLEVIGVEHAERLSLADAIAVLDEALRDLAVHPKSKIAFDAWPDSGSEAAGLVDVLVRDRGDENGAVGAAAVVSLPALESQAPTRSARRIEPSSGE